jgi:hypothetical protein
MVRSREMHRIGLFVGATGRSLVMVMTNGIGAHLTNDEKRAHLTDLKREHLIDEGAQSPASALGVLDHETTTGYPRHSGSTIGQELKWLAKRVREPPTAAATAAWSRADRFGPAPERGHKA